MFRIRYVLLLERERLSEEYLDLRKMKELVIEITNMFTKRDIFCLEYAAME